MPRWRLLDDSKEKWIEAIPKRTRRKDGDLLSSIWICDNVSNSICHIYLYFKHVCPIGKSWLTVSYWFTIHFSVNQATNLGVILQYSLGLIPNLPDKANFIYQPVSCWVYPKYITSLYISLIHHYDSSINQHYLMFLHQFLMLTVSLTLSHVFQTPW